MSASTPLVTACPDCDSSGIYSRRWRADGKRARDDERWRCPACGGVFREPIERPYRRRWRHRADSEPSAAATRGIARRLEQMDPDDFPPEADP